MKTEDINKIIQDQFSLDPIDLTEPEKLTIEMKEALAQAYAMPGFRLYLNNAINKLRINAVEKSSDWEGVLYRRGGIIFLKQLNDISKSCYNDYLSLKKIAKK